MSRSLIELEGVIDAEVDFGNKTALVTYEPSEVNIEAMIAATTNMGFPSSVKTTEN